MRRRELAELGALLRERGLTERAVLLCFGVHAVAQAAGRAAAQPAPRERPPPAAVLPWLFVGGRALSREALDDLLGRDGVAALERAGLLELTGASARARRLLLPLGESLVACDPPGEGAIRPDDSSFHLLGALGQRRVGRWLDVGTGTAVAPLARRGLAREVRATDVDTRALALADLGASLSGAEEITLAEADLLGAGASEPFDLVTFNPPLPAKGGLDLIRRFWAEVPRAVCSGGEVVVHSALADPERPFPESLDGETVVALYTPPEEAAQFAVTRWRPGAPRGRRGVRVPLSPRRPHVSAGDLG